MADVFRNVFVPSNVKFLLKGLGLTISLSIIVIILSLAFGTLLALGRSYAKGFLGKLAGAYIEIFRNTPLLLWVLSCAFIVRGGTVLARGGLALALYTSAVVAEIVRGGLNSVDKGQFEAAEAQGFKFIQILLLVILPQCFRKIVPSLLSQFITTIKDTSFLQIIAIPEFTRSGFVVMGQYTKSAEVFMIFGVLALGYFSVCFFLSCAVRLIEKQTATG